MHRPVVRKSPTLTRSWSNPVVRLHYVEVAEPDLASPTSDLGRLRAALEREWELTGLTCDAHVLPGLQKTLRRGQLGRHGRRARRRRRSPASGRGLHETMLGVAFDIGSTTIAGHLCDLTTGEVLASAGEMNPQIRFGEDLMSRVSYVMMNPGGEGPHRAVRGALRSSSPSCANDAGVSRDDMLEIVLVGNPIMHHIVARHRPDPARRAPFTLATAEAVRCPAVDLGLPVHPAHACTCCRASPVTSAPTPPP